MGQQQPDKRQSAADLTRDQGAGKKDMGRDTDSQIDRSQSKDATKPQGFDKKQSGNR